MTPAEANQKGGAWHTEKQFVSVDFETTFDFELSEGDNDPDGGAGFVFVIQNDNDSALGGGFGYDGTVNSLAVEFDTYKNTKYGDTSESQVSVHTRGVHPNDKDEAYSIGRFDAPLDDGQMHTAKVAYVPGTLSVFLDDLVTPALTVPIDLAQVLGLDHGRAWLGFNAATGGGWQNHDILNWQFDNPVDTTTTMAVGDVSQAEGDSGTTDFLFTVTRAGDTSGSTSVDWATADDTATAGTDYAADSGTFLFDPGEVEKTITVTVSGDTEIELHERFLVNLSVPVGATVVDGQAVGTILRDEPPLPVDFPDFSDPSGLNLIGDAAIRYSDVLRLTPAQSGQRGAAWYTAKQYVSAGFQTTFDFVLTQGHQGTSGGAGFTFVVQSDNDSALRAGGGYMAYNGMLNSLAVEFDTNKNNEFGDPSESHVSVHTGGAAPNSVDEAYSIGWFNTPLDNRKIHTAKIAYVPGTLSIFLDDLVTPALTVPIDLGHTLDLDGGRAWVGFTAATGGGWQNHDILNWQFDAVVGGSTALVVDDVSQVEGDSGTTDYLFTVTRLGDTSGSASVDWATADDTATAGTDYAADSAALLFDPGEVEKTIAVTVTGDTEIEPPETFLVNLSGAVGAALVDDQAVGTILSDDVLISINDVTVTEGDDTAQFIDTFVPAGSGLDHSRDVLFGSDGLLYVSSHGTDEVLRYDATTGQFVDVFVGAGSGGLDRPSGLTFGPDANLYVSSAWTDEILRYDGTTGAFIDAFVTAGSGGLDNPTHLEFGPDGSLYVSSWGTDEVLRYDGTTGAFIDAFVPAGSGGLNAPQDLSFGPDSALYVASGQSRQVLRYDGISGDFLDVFVSAGAGGLDRPVGLVFNAAGNLLVASAATNEVLRFDGSSGVFLNAYVPSGAGGLNEPRGLNFGPDGNLYVASADSNEVLRYGAGSHAIFTVSLSSSSPVPVTIDFSTADGTAVAGSDYDASTGTLAFDPGVTTRLIIVATIDNAVWEPEEEFYVDRSNPSGAIIADGHGVATIGDDEPTITIDDVSVVEGDDTPRFIDDFVPAGSGGLDHSRDVLFGPDGLLYVSSNLTDEVLRFDAATGQFVDAFVTAGSGGLDRTSGLTFGPDANLYVSSAATDQVLRYDGTTGAFIDAFVTAGSGGLDNPTHLKFGPDGNLYVSSNPTDELLRYDGATGAFIDAFVPAGSGGLDNPNELIFRPDGALYVASAQSDQVLRYDGTSGAFIDVFVGAGAGGLDTPVGLVFDADGDLLVVSDNTNAVLRFDGSAGAFLDAYVPSGAGGLNEPRGLKFGPDGNLYVTSAGTDEVLRYGPSSQAVFTVSLSHPHKIPVTVDFSTADGTAIAGSDYEATSGTVVFDRGVTTRSIIAPTLDDGEWEYDEDFFVNLSNPSGAGIADGQGTARIMDDGEGPMDFGDAPDPTYPTLLANSGARHTIGGPFLGAMVDAEPDGQPTAAATGDDLAGVPDDEDGVTFLTPLSRGETARVNVVMTFCPVGGLFSGWVDFNADGDWDDAGEQVFTDVSLTPATVNQLGFTVPATAKPGFTYARFRVSTAGGLSYDGPAADGEVEDYRVEIPTDPVHVYATAGDDTIRLNADGTGHTVEVNGAVYPIDGCSELYLHGLGGNDTIRVYLTAGDEDAYLDVGTLYVDGLPSYEFYADSVEAVVVYGGGGSDEAYLTGSAGNDTFTSYETQSYLEGGGVFNCVRDFDYVEADLSVTGGGGTDDRAYLYDSAAAADDIFYGYPDHGLMDRAGTAADANAIGFDAVKACATGGGANDQAYLCGSAGEDRLNSYETYSYLHGTGYYNFAWGFDYVEIDVSPGGATSADRAWMFDSDAAVDDTFYGEPSQSRMVFNTGKQNKAIGFDIVRAYATGGGSNDEAYLTGSVGNDRFISYETSGYMYGPGYWNLARGFDYVKADVTPGSATSYDRAWLYDSDAPADDTFYGDVGDSRMDRGSDTVIDAWAVAFDDVRATASGGGANDRAYLTGSAGNDRFYGYQTHSYLQGPGYYTLSKGFDYVEADVSGSSGSDRADLYHFAGIDSFFALGSTGQMSYAAGSSIQATGVAAGFAHLGPEDSATIILPSVWTAPGSSASPLLLGKQAEMWSINLDFAGWIAARNQAKATSGRDADGEETDPTGLDYLFALYGSQ